MNGGSRRTGTRGLVTAAALTLGAALAFSISPHAAEAKTPGDYFLFTGVTRPVTVLLTGFSEEAGRRVFPY